MTARMERRRARARLVSESLFVDQAVLGLHPVREGMLLWVALIVTADTEGRGEGNPTVLCETILGGIRHGRERVFTPKLVTDLLAQMAKKQKDGTALIRCYQDGHRQYVELLNWKSHQSFKYSKPERPEPKPQQELEGMTKDVVDGIAQSKREAQERLHERVATEFGTDEYHKAAGILWKRGVHNVDQIVEVLTRARLANPRNLIAYVQHPGLQGTALSVEVENRAAREKKQRGEDKRGAAPGDMSPVADIISNVLKNTGGGQ